MKIEFNSLDRCFGVRQRKRCHWFSTLLSDQLKLNTWGSIEQSWHIVVGVDSGIAFLV